MVFAISTHTDTHEPSGRQHPEHLRIRPGDAHAVNILVTSAAGTNGDGYGSILAFTLDGKMLGAFGADSGITDPRGLRVHPDGDRVYVNNGDDRILSLDPHGRIAAKTGPIANLNPGGGNFGPDGRYYIGSRTARTIMAFPPGLLGSGKAILPSGVVPFPRGFALAPDGRLFLASGTSPSGDGDDTILAFAPDLTLSAERFVDDTQLSPLDLAIAPNGNVLVSSEFPFGRPDAVTTVREYDAGSGKLVRIFSPDGSVGFRKPRGLRFGPDGNLYCVAHGEIVAFDFGDGRFLGAVARLDRLNGQAIEFFPLR
jgi:DNA-binding beta-propeller fold protein YncE